MAVSPSSVRIDLARDSYFDAFTLQTFKDRYLVGEEKSPQQAFARACAAFADNAAHAQRLYDYVSKGWFMFATPLLSNGGTARGLPISCFLTFAEDSLSSITDHYTEITFLSAKGGGIGGYWGALRGNGEKTSRGSQSSGIIPFISVIDRLILAVSQGGTRRGSYAAYIDVWHPEIEEFAAGRKPTGGDENRKFLNLHNAVNLTDEFMYAVRDDLPFALRSPKTGLPVKTVQARALWKQLIELRKQTGEPYFFFVDTANRALPEAQKAKGLKVHQSNLCVGPLTEVLTPDGYYPISVLAGSNIPVWNGEQFSTVEVVQTNEPGKPSELVRVYFRDGGFLDCTPYHKFYLVDGTEVRAGLLEPGMVLEAVKHPIIYKDATRKVSAKDYTEGYVTFRGFADKNRVNVYVEGSHDRVIKTLMENSVDAEFDSDTSSMYIRYEPDTLTTSTISTERGCDAVYSWLAGALDAAGEVVTTPEGTYYALLTPDDDLVRSLRLYALESGLHPVIRIGDSHAAFMLPAADLVALRPYLQAPISDELQEEINLDSQDLCFENPVVVDVSPLPWNSDTFCFTESLRSRGTFNGYLTGNCTEITLATGRDNSGNMRTAVCCLSSVNGETYDEWKNDPRFIEDLMRMLDNALQVFIDEAPEEMANAVYSATQERSVGLGLLGFHAYLQKHMIAFESQEARDVNIAMFKNIRRQADAASLNLGAERGEAPDMRGTGERFAHKLAIAPNASSSILCRNTSPSIEPFRANAYLHKTLSGSFPVKNPYLVQALRNLGLDTENIWKQIVADEGSIQNLGERVGDKFRFEVSNGAFVEVELETWLHIQAVFKTFTEIDMRWVIALAADRGPEICQAQSVNLAFPHDADAEYLSEVHFMAWEFGLKSLYYLRSTTPRRAENTNKKVERVKVEGADHTYPNPDHPYPNPEEIYAGVNEKFVANTLSINPADDSTCLSCEG